MRSIMGKEHNRHIMKNKNIIRFVQSLVLLPVMTMSMTGSSVNIEKTQGVLVRKFNIEIKGKSDTLAISKAMEEEKALDQIKADAIDAYFAKYDMPMEGTGMKMVIEAKKNDIDWRLLPAIAVRESTGGKYSCKKVTYSSFGWGSCKINFESHNKAIEIVALNLGGNNPNTDQHYEDKSVKEILQAYNPPSVVKYYADQVMKIMDNIGPENMQLALEA